MWLSLIAEFKVDGEDAYKTVAMNDFVAQNPEWVKAFLEKYTPIG
jgi:ABC-type nitrate/sulfonate/bicarbonate transport system substrate-binding protein